MVLVVRGRLLPPPGYPVIPLAEKAAVVILLVATVLMETIQGMGERGRLAPSVVAVD